MNQVSHDLDLICWLFGKPVQVCAFAGNQAHNSQVDDIACVNLLFENGAFGNFQFSINHPGVFNTRQVVGDIGMLVFNKVKSLVDDQDDQILLGKFENFVYNLAKHLENYHHQPAVTSKRVKLLNINDHSRIKIIARYFDNKIFLRITRNKWSLQRTEWLRWSKPVGYFQIFHNLIDVIKREQLPIVSGESAARTVELINAIILSAIRRKIVTLPLDSDEYDEVFDELCHGKAEIKSYI